MAINYPLVSADQLFSIKGVSLGCAQAGIRYQNRDDVLLMRIDKGASVAGVFTENIYCAAPVTVCRNHLNAKDRRNLIDNNDLSTIFPKNPSIRALVINSGNANAGNGPQGMDAANQTCNALAHLLSIESKQVLPFSTGVILEPLPVDRLTAALPQAMSDCRENNWFRAAKAIMTTDTEPKAISRRCEIDGDLITVTGIAKGSGMICPNMATMLGFVATDAKISQDVLEKLVRDVADNSFNSISVDGDTSTNDSFIIIATGKSTLPIIDSVTHRNYAKLYSLLEEVAVELAKMIIRDAEGATKFITINVSGGNSKEDCKKVAYTIASSPLVKTAFYASDANLGRILAAIGRSGVSTLDIREVDFNLNGLLVVKNGCRHSSYTDEAGGLEMKKSEILLDIKIGSGMHHATVWTCDLSHEYVSINADYRS